MASYEHLPIYKKSLELTIFLENCVKGFSRYNKYSLGADLRNSARELATMVIRTNSKRDKIASLIELRDKSEEMKLLIVLAKETKAFKNFTHFQTAAVLAVEISKQSEGWLKSQIPKRSESRHI